MPSQVDRGCCFVGEPLAALTQTAAPSVASRLAVLGLPDLPHRRAQQRRVRRPAASLRIRRANSRTSRRPSWQRDGATAGSTCPSLDPSKRFMLDFHAGSRPSGTVRRGAPPPITALPERFPSPALKSNLLFHLRFHVPYRPPCRAAPDAGALASAMEHPAVRGQSGWSLPLQYPRTSPSPNAILH
jgi:hypothetical protein